MENQKDSENTYPDFNCGTDENGHSPEESLTEKNVTGENTIAEKTMEEDGEANASLQLISASEDEFLKDDTPEVHDKVDNNVEDENDLSALKFKIKQEINMMMSYALRSGRKIPEEATALIYSDNAVQLIKAHGIICDTLAPATPETIMYTGKFYNTKRSFVLFSPIPLVRNFTIISITAILSLVISSLSSEVNTETLSKGILNNHGLSLLMNLLFLCSASLMGAAFFLLSKLTREVKEASLSADDATYYWTMLIMGILSGMILSEGVSVKADAVSTSVETNRLIFAILGGFSSEVVYRILQNIMQKIQSAISAV
ncbi:MAG: hypothetical protein KDD04_08715 [Sinomicrobium sp.]|nr:hypothetical protein [Sinomicrobium sp.]